MDWEVIVVEPALSWLHDLRQSDRAILVQISKAITALRREGPAMGRPLVDTVRGRAVFLVGGDKAGEWQGWYRSAIPLAEKAYADYLAEGEEGTP
ncbi:type II toxin-antitoxin system RelE/ParE family toxin [Streptomyces sp. NPDC054958]